MFKLNERNRMSQEQHKDQPPTSEELLTDAEKFARWARNLYGKDYSLANTAALVSLAASAVVIARSLSEQTIMMREVSLPEMTSVLEGGE
jgi:hypothetical protein